MSVDVPPEDLQQALRTLARFLAPYLAQELSALGVQVAEQPGDTARAVPSAGGRKRSSRRAATRYDDQRAEAFVKALPPDVAARALIFFEALSKHPHRVDSATLSEWLGAEPRELAGLLTTPLKRAAKRLGSGDPWEIAEQTRARTTWADYDGTAAAIASALRVAVDEHRTTVDLSTQRPVPSAVFVWAPEFTEGLPPYPGGPGDSSTLRDSAPGTRAVIYRAHHDQAIVAMFDVAEPARAHPDWRWYAEGWYHVLKEPIPRDRLLEHPDLDKVFARIQGRRRLPAAAQQALRPLMEEQYREGTLPTFTSS